MEKESYYEVIIIDRISREWLEEIIFYTNEEIKAAKDYIAEPDNYEVVFREVALISDVSFREAYDFAKAHKKDYFYYNAEMLCQSFISESVKNFIRNLEDHLAEKDNNWELSAPDFFWARQLGANEERAVREKYNL